MSAQRVSCRVEKMVNRVAVLVDGDNVSAAFADQILRCGQRLGRLDIARVYAGANSLSQWLTMAGFRYIHAGAGKNAADLLLTIDAMELAFGQAPDAFVIASSESDFTHLAHRLREKGLHVCGMGEAKTLPTFRAACTEFVQMQVRVAEVVKPVEKAKPAPSAPGSELDRNIQAIIEQHGAKGQSIRINDLSNLMHKHHQTHISTQIEKTWYAYLMSRPDLYDADPRGKDAMVRLRRRGLTAVA